MRGNLTLALALLLLLLPPSVHVHPLTASQGPTSLGPTLASSYTAVCANRYLVHVNVSTPMVWWVGHENPLTVRVRVLDELPAATAVTATVTVDRVSASVPLGRVGPGTGELSAVLSVPLPPSAVKAPAERESRQAQLTVSFSELRCSLTVSMWVVVAASRVALEASLSARPNPVEVNASAEIVAELRNPTPDPATDLDMQLYVNGTLVQRLRLPILPPSASYALTVAYTARAPGTYVVELKVTYTTPYATQEVAVAAAALKAKARPRLSLAANTTLSQVGRPVALRGAVEPPTPEPKVVVLEVSHDALSWAELARLTVTRSFEHVWVPRRPGLYYLRARVLESEGLFAGTTGALAVVAEKARPSVTVGVAWPYVEVGTPVPVKVTIMPPLTDSVEVHYRLLNESSWTRAPAKVDKVKGVVELTLSRPGVYEVKVVVPESEESYGAESETVVLYVAPPRGTPTSTSKPEAAAAPPWPPRPEVLALAAAAVGVALLLLGAARRGPPPGP